MSVRLVDEILGRHPKRETRKATRTHSTKTPPPRRMFDAATVIRARALRKLGLTYREVARVMRINPHSVRDMCLALSYADVPQPGERDVIAAAQALAKSVIDRGARA